MNQTAAQPDAATAWWLRKPEPAARPNAEQLARNMLEGREYAFLTWRQTLYLADRLVAEWRRDGEQLTDQGVRFGNGVVDYGARLRARGDSLVSYWLVSIYGTSVGVLMPEPPADEVRPLPFEERRRLRDALARFLESERDAAAGRFTAARASIGRFLEEHGDALRAARSALFVPEDLYPRDDEPGHGIVNHQLWYYSNQLFGREHYVNHAYRVLRHGGTRVGAWRLAYMSTHEPSARGEYSELGLKGSRGAVVLLHPDGREERRTLPQGQAGPLEGW